MNICKPAWWKPLASVLPAFALFASVLSALSEGIPEPSIVLYGVIDDASANVRVTTGTLEWTFQPESGAEPIVVSGELRNINDQFSYVLLVPCESPLPNEPSSPDTLQLTASPTTYDFSNATVNGEAASFLMPALQSLTLTTADRGRIKRIDLAISVTVIDSDGNGIPDDWEMEHFNGQVGVDPKDDSDGDGLSNEAEWKAGTDPNDFQSQFSFIKVATQEQGGVLIEWSSAESRSYVVLRSTSITGDFTPVASGVTATPPANSYQDGTADGEGPYFYLLQVEEP